MTREEAIKILKAIRVYECYPKSASEETKEAIDMAIVALADRPTESDFISKAEVLEIYSELYWFDSDCEVVSKAEVDKIYERLQSLPSADAVEVVWCKDCKHSHMTHDGRCKYCDELDAEGEAWFFEGDFFCAYGERREP